MFLRALIAFLALPGVVAGIVPLLIVGGDVQLAKTGPYGIILLSIGFLLLLWCARDFSISGKGTLAPWDPPKRLVVVGLYRLMRNPMYLAVLTLVAGWSLGSGSLWLGLYLCVLAVGFHRKVVRREEPWLAQQFGDDWEAYSKAVPRWLPRRSLAPESTPRKGHGPGIRRE